MAINEKISIPINSPLDVRNISFVAEFNPNPATK